MASPVREPAAVIGAAGFIGSRLVRALREAGIPAFSFVRQSPYLRDGPAAEELRRARTVFYLATSITPALAEQHPDLVEADRSAFVALLRQLGDAGTRPTVVLTSSGGTAYDPDVPPPYCEDSPVRPTSRYGKAKLRLEEELLSHGDVIRPVVLRLANVYGPGQRSCNGLGVIPHWLEAIAAGRPVRVLGPWETSRDYVYVDDTVDAMVRLHLLSSGHDRLPEADLPSVINIGSGVPVSLGTLLSVVSKVIGFTPVVDHGAPRSFDRAATWLDVTRAWKALGWRPSTPLETGVARAWRALRPASDRLHSPDPHEDTTMSRTDRCHSQGSAGGAAQ